MGHLRNQYTPQTVKWHKVVECIANGDDAAVVASATIAAAERGLRVADSDPGLSHVVWLLARIALAARQHDFVHALGQLGIELSDQPSTVELIAAYSDRVDIDLTQRRSRSDIGEMAQLAGAEALATFVASRSATLFGESEASLRDSVRSLSTAEGFATFAHSFFARLTERYLGYHLSRELSQHVGTNQRFADPASHSDFLARLHAHSREVSVIVREFAGGWYAKSQFETGLSAGSAAGFAKYCVTKIREEIRHRGAADVG